jgi:oligoribonuclease (3'-5' exoribonuclease)
MTPSCNGMHHYFFRFADVDGSTLLELKELHRDAPEFYFATLKDELHLNLKQILRFTKELKKIH